MLYQPVTLLIPACNEASVIGQTIAAIRPYLLEDDRIVVIDDGSADSTALVAIQAGAQVIRRPTIEAASSKGAALSWGLRQLHLSDTDAIVVLDADTEIDPGFIQAIRARFAAGAQVVQGFVMPIGASRRLIPSISACSTLMEQEVDDRLRAWLGWPVRLRGTGMAFDGRLLAEVALDLKTATEDVELSLRLMARGVRVIFAPEAVIYDPVPVSESAASNQRARWLRGQGMVWRLYWRLLLRLSFYGPAAWSLIGSLLFKPRSLLVSAKLILFLLSLLHNSLWLISAGLGFSLLADAIYVSVAVLLFSASRQDSVRGLVTYMGMWLNSLSLAVRGSRRWLRARP